LNKKVPNQLEPKMQKTQNSFVEKKNQKENPKKKKKPQAKPSDTGRDKVCKNQTETKN